MPRKPIAPHKATSHALDLKKALQDTFDLKQAALNFNDFYVAVDKVVATGKADSLAQMLSEMSTTKFKDWFDEINRAITTSSSDFALVSLFSNQYNKLGVYLSLIPKLFSQFDRDRDVKSHDIISNNFVSFIFSKEEIMEPLIHSMNEIIKKFRDGSENDYSIVKNLTNLLYQFEGSCEKSWLESFKEEVADNIAEFYAEFKEENFVGKFSDYIKTCMAALDKEYNFISILFRKEHVKSISLVAFDYLFTNFQDDFLQSEDGKPPVIAEALDSDDISPLKWLVSRYIYFGNESDEVVDAVVSYINSQYDELAIKFTEKADEKAKKAKTAATKKAKTGAAKKGAEAKKSPKWVKNVEKLIAVFDGYSAKFTAIFSAVDGAKKKYEEMLEMALNKQELDLANNFANYLDYLLCSRLRSVENKNAFEQTIKNLVGKINDKGRFQNVSEFKLKYRIIRFREENKKNEDLVVNAIRKVKTLNEYASSFFEPLYLQLKESNATLQLFKEQKKDILSRDYSQLKFIPTVVSSNNLNLTGLSEIPHFVAPICNLFMDFYKSRNEKVRVELIPELSITEFILSVPPIGKVIMRRNYTITCDIVAGAIIDAVSKATEKDGITIAEICKLPFDKEKIKKYIKLLMKDIPILKRTVHSLDNPTKIMDTDYIDLNHKFKHPTLKVSIPLIDDKKKEKINKIDAAKRKLRIQMEIMKYLKTKATGMKKKEILDYVYENLKSAINARYDEIDETFGTLSSHYDYDQETDTYTYVRSMSIRR